MVPHNLVYFVTRTFIHVCRIGTVVDGIQIGDIATEKPSYLTAAPVAEKDCCDHRHHAAPAPSSSVPPLPAASSPPVSPSGIRVCVLTVSDRVSRGEAVDKSGPEAVRLVAGIPGKHVKLLLAGCSLQALCCACTCTFRRVLRPYIALRLLLSQVLRWLSQ